MGKAMAIRQAWGWLKRRRGRLAGVAALLLVAACTATAPPAIRERTLAPGPGSVALRQGVPLAETQGGPAELGRQQGELFGDQIRTLLKLVRFSPQFAVAAADVAKLEGRIAPAHRREMQQMAAAAGVPYARLLAANVALDTLCTVLVAGADGAGPVRIARNMDFFPPHLLGPATVVLLRRPAGAHAFASIGWPGYAGVITGMNEHGVTVAILQNHGSTKEVRAGTPVAFRAREILERAADAEQGAAIFAAGPVASSHFLLVADARTACVRWQDAAGRFHRRDAANGWLPWSNGEPDAAGVQHDRRARELAAAIAGLAGGAPAADGPWLKRTLAGVRLPLLNAQAMLLLPGERRLELARARGAHPAVAGPWIRLDLAPALRPGTAE
ncbi:MAG: C45 family peptidase [Lentisphaeria bacterium]|jgi:hypothetical protein